MENITLVTDGRRRGSEGTILGRLEGPGEVVGHRRDSGYGSNRLGSTRCGVNVAWAPSRGFAASPGPRTPVFVAQKSGPRAR